MQTAWQKPRIPALVGLGIETFTTYAHAARLPSRSTYCQYPQADYLRQVEDPLCGQRQ